MGKKVRELRGVDGTPQQIRSAIEYALQRMNASSVAWLPDGSRVNAQLSVNFRSWGENVEITVGERAVTIESTSRLPTQVIDWGRN